MKRYRQHEIMNKSMKKLVITILIIVVIVVLIYQNTTVAETHYNIQSNIVNNFKIAHISDYHNSNFDTQALKIIAKEQPDIIVITGDLIDSHRTNISKAVGFINNMMKIAQCYYVTGNHEAWLYNTDKEAYIAFENDIINTGCIILNNESVNISNIRLTGLSDNAFNTENITEINKDNTFRIILSHRPNIKLHEKYNADLILCGHTHGGQIRIPFIGGLVAPDQGLFPKYSYGLYNNKMIINSGLGNSTIPIRVNNSPEVVIININKKGKAR